MAFINPGRKRPPGIPVYNRLIVIAEKNDLQKIVDTLGHRYTLPEGDAWLHSPIFSLQNIVAPPAKVDEIFYPSKEAWCRAHWGVAQDVSDVTIEAAMASMWVIRYESINQEPSNALAIFSRRFTEATFKNISCLVDGSGVRKTFRRGHSSDHDRWGPPNTHKHYQRLMGSDSCKCNYMHTPHARYPYVDCERPPIPTDQAIAEFDETNYWLER